MTVVDPRTASPDVAPVCVRRLDALLDGWEVVESVCGVVVA